MAFRDSDGTIRIDETAAAKDISVIRSAGERLRNSQELLTRILNISSDFSGEAANSITELAAHLREQVALMVNVCDTASDSISAIVEKYRQKDQKAADMISSSIR